MSWACTLATISLVHPLDGVLCTKLPLGLRVGARYPGRAPALVRGVERRLLTSEPELLAHGSRACEPRGKCAPSHVTSRKRRHGGVGSAPGLGLTPRTALAISDVQACCSATLAGGWRLCHRRRAAARLLMSRSGGSFDASAAALSACVAARSSSMVQPCGLAASSFAIAVAAAACLVSRGGGSHRRVRRRALCVRGGAQ